MLVKPHHGENKGWGRPGEGMYFKGHQNRWLTKWEKLSTSLKSGKRLLSVGYITEHIYDSSPEGLGHRLDHHEAQDGATHRL